MMSYEIIGAEDLIRELEDKQPKELLKDSKKALRRAGSIAVKKLRPKIPKRWRKLVKSKVKQLKNGYQFVEVGLYENDFGNTSSDFLKAYWSNYGTITKRDPKHKFHSPVKEDVKDRRNNIGQPYTNFFEEAIEGLAQSIVENYEMELDDDEE